MATPRMNRRGFLGAIAGGLVLDPERLLWRPGRKLISIPKPTLDAGECVGAERRYAKIREDWRRLPGNRWQMDRYLEGRLIQSQCFPAPPFFILQAARITFP